MRSPYQPTSTGATGTPSFCLLPPSPPCGSCEPNGSGGGVCENANGLPVLVGRSWVQLNVCDQPVAIVEPNDS